MATDLTFNIKAHDLASKVFSNVGKNSSLLGKTFAGVGAIASKAFVGAGAAAVSLGAVAAAAGLKTAAGLETSSVAFETLLGSGQKAQAFLGQLNKFATRTPFSLPGVTDAAVKLLGVGQNAKDVIPTLTALGDTAGAVGLKQEDFSRVILAVTQSMAKGKIQAEELNQINEAGIPILSILSKALGKPQSAILDLASSGKLLSKDVFPKLFTQMHKDYGGAMSKQSMTLTGLWSTLMDTFNTGAAQVLTPLLPLIKKGLAGAIASIGPIVEGLSTNLTGFLTTIGPVFEQATKLAKSFFTGLQGGQGGGSGPFADALAAGQKVRDIFEAVKPVVADAVTTLLGLGKAVVTGLAPAFSAIGSLIQTLAPVFTTVIGFVKSLVPAFGGIAGAIGKFIGAILPVIQPFIAQIVSVLGPGLKQISQIINTQVVPAFASFLSAITPLIQFIIKFAGPSIVATFKGIITALQGAFTIIAGIFNFFAALFTGNWSKLWDSVKQIASGAFKVLQGAFKVLMAGILPRLLTAGGKLLISAAGKLFSAIGGLFTRGWAALKRTFSRGVDAVVGFFKALPGKAARALSNFGKTLSGVFSRAFHAMIKVSAETVKGLITFVRKLPGRIVRALGNTGKLLYGAGRAIISGLINGISSLITSLRRKVGSVASLIKNALPNSPAAKQGPLKGIHFEDIGATIISDLRKGLTAGQLGLARDFQGVAGQLKPLRSGVGGTGLQPVAAGTGTGTVVNHFSFNFTGPVGSERQLNDWLSHSLDTLKRQGRIRFPS